LFCLSIMAKGSRSNRKKAIRTVRRQQSADWQVEADKRRQDLLQQCSEAAPVPVENVAAPEEDEAPADGMETDIRHKKKRKPIKKARGGICKGYSKQVGVLHKWTLDHPPKLKKRNKGKKRS
jgi:hypothetical protein